MRPAVAGALHRDGELRPGPLFEPGEVERELPLATHRQAPVVGVDVRHVEVDQQVVEADRRDRVAECFERHPVIAGRELELLEADALHAVSL